MAKAKKIVDDLLKVNAKGFDEELANTARIGGRIASTNKLDPVVDTTVSDDIFAELMSKQKEEPNQVLYEEFLHRKPKDTDRLADPADVQAEIDMIVAEGGESARLVAITDPMVRNIEYRFQATTPDEFKMRVENQLIDPEYRAAVITADMLDGEMSSTRIILSDERRAYYNDRVLAGLRRNNARYQRLVDDLTKDNAWGDEVFFHIEYQHLTDEAMSFPQLGPKPNESGIHAGSYSAAVQATYKHDDVLIKRQKDFEWNLARAANDSGLEKKELELIVGKTLNDYFRTQFQQGRNAAANVWNEVGMDLRERFIANGVEPSQAAMWIAKMKGLPTPSVTPYFSLDKNGLFMPDAGNWYNDTVKGHLINIFPEDEAIIVALPEEHALGIQQYIESKGYDHIAYVNQAEDHGSISILSWKKENMVSIWDERFVGRAGGPAAMAAFYMATAGMGQEDADIRTEE